MESSLIPLVNNQFPIEELRHPHAQKSTPLKSSPLEGEYIPPECAAPRRRQPPDIIFRVFIEIGVSKSPLLEHKENEFMTAYGLSAYQELEEFDKKEIKGQYINIIT